MAGRPFLRISMTSHDTVTVVVVQMILKNNHELGTREYNRKKKRKKHALD